MFEIELFICIKMDLALNNLEWWIYHKKIRRALYQKEKPSTVLNHRNENLIDFKKNE